MAALFINSEFELCSNGRAMLFKTC